MGESIMLLQLLPHALEAQEGRSGSTQGAAAFLDVRPGVSVRQMRSHWRLLCLPAQVLPQRLDKWQ